MFETYYLLKKALKIKKNKTYYLLIIVCPMAYLVSYCFDL